jgi:hypothetical protein
MISVTMTEVEQSLCSQALSGDQGEVLCDLITDQIVLDDKLSADHKAGAGIVLKFLRALKDDKNLIKTEPTK